MLDMKDYKYTIYKTTKVCKKSLNFKALIWNKTRSHDIRKAEPVLPQCIKLGIFMKMTWAKFILTKNHDII